MKVLALAVIVAFLAVASALTDEQKEKLKTIHKECVEASKVDKELPKKAREHGHFENDPKFKEYLFCFTKKLGFMNEAGEFQKEVMKTKLTPTLGEEAVSKLLTQCAVQKSSPQESAFDYTVCAHHHNSHNHKK